MIKKYSYLSFSLFLDRRLPKPMAFLKTQIQGKQDIVSEAIGEIALKAFPNSKMILL
jgi:hypothetical protein